MSPTPEPQAEPSLQQGELSLPDALRQAVLWHQEGQVHAAAEIYRRILQLVPDHPEALHFQGVALHQLGRSEGGKPVVGLIVSAQCRPKMESDDFRQRP